jgi:hypothetical protein
MKPMHAGIARLMRRAFEGENLEPLAQELLQRLQFDEHDANAAIDLASILELAGDPSLALEFQESALSIQQVYRTQAASDPNSLRVLAIKSRGVIMDNMPIEFLLESAPVQLESFYVGLGIPMPSELPEHDVAVVAICESDANQHVLSQLTQVAEHWPRPVLNTPARIVNLSRERLGNLVQGIEHLTFAGSIRLGRSELQSNSPWAAETLANVSDGWIIRPINSHAGHGLERIANQGQLEAYLRQAHEDTFLVAPFVPYASSDGAFRKYRVALIQGESYPVHMAISTRWMVHYLNADMLENAEHRDEEAEWMQGYADRFGMKHARALRALSEQIGLDYVVLDCAETAAGDLLVFEADNGAVVHAMDPASMFPYKRPAMQNIFDAFAKLLHSAIEQSPVQKAA